MSQTTKVFLGILTALPLLMLFGLLAVAFGMILGLFEESAFDTDANEAFMRTQAFYLILFSILLTVLSFAMLIYYIVHAIANKKIDSNIQVVWILILLFTSPIGSMVYWYVNIWRDHLLEDPIDQTPVSRYTN